MGWILIPLMTAIVVSLAFDRRDIAGGVLIVMGAALAALVLLNTEPRGWPWEVIILVVIVGAVVSATLRRWKIGVGLLFLAFVLAKVAIDAGWL